MNRPRRNSEAEHHAIYKRTSISRKPEELVERRMAHAETLRKKHREQLITAKRFRNLTRHEEYESAGEEEPESEKRTEHDDDISPYYRLSTRQVESLANDLKSYDMRTRIQAASYISKFVLEPAESLIKYISEGDCIQVLTQMMTGPNIEEQIEATQTISNIAAGPYALWKKSIFAVPYLTALLGSDNMNLREIAAGALGNIAAEDLGDMNDEDDKTRAIIRNNGAIKPLTRMLDSGDVPLIQSACFALANLARGEEKELEDFLNVGLIDKLVNHLTNDNDTIVEVCWTISYLTAGSEKCRQEALAKGIAEPLVKALVSLSEQGPVVLPALRSLGNLCGKEDNLRILVEQPYFLPTVLKLVNSEERDNTMIIEQVQGLNANEVLSEVMTKGAFDIRKGAAYCIMNIANHGPEYLDRLCSKRILTAFLDLLRSQEADMIRLALGYIELLLTQSPKGKEVIDNTSECMEALATVTPAPDPELFAFANKLVDEYFGESPEMS
ncbi:hypothetical protein G6F57_008291 [Rhizopus arrhizus]|uniref:Importin subunit alpha n=1 Tax=Rhizopus oryzae TaxID=64495 RepID=A0A9P6X9F2_RHIOR|nr:hypothetical protein G6F23_005016 [Rhizopus arrhizus]KAG0759904.1 hypothetical protein G6F24_008723 [Rhizopus arrhizus]KAG0786158.1 hypothetical protein G6F21_008790 [Rhizopus arrhizus]KAG0800403.1 hypothetical protein G6F22_002269 [Rhizopus arrhizus]KAG0809298.1 hypothetical protein G6F20_008887 [Rhizopus arrhizus]